MNRRSTSPSASVPSASTQAVTPRRPRAAALKAAPWPGWTCSIGRAGRVQGRFSMSTTRQAPLSASRRDPGGTWLKSGSPRSTIPAPVSVGSSAGRPIAAAIWASSSAERIDTCRVLRIGVPRG